LTGTVVDPGHEVFFDLAQRRDDLPIALDLGFEDFDMADQFHGGH
jgi:hypothetical protein